jgi:hypothetical protein
MSYIISIISIFRKLVQRRVYKLLIIGALSLIFVAMIYLPIMTLETEKTTNKLIEYGWDAPTPDFLKQNIKQMEQSPFDGVVVKLHAGKEVFNRTAYSDLAFTQDRQDLAATKSTRLTDNFLIMWSGTEKGWNWFNNSDWAAAEKNIRNFAKTSKIGNFRGIAFDSESYTNSPWQYSKQPQQQSKTFKEYQRQVRKRGAQFMKAIQAEQPNPQFLTFGLLSWMRDVFESASDPAKLQQQLANHTYGLWPAFINGMLDATKLGSMIVDGHEFSYYFYSAAPFEDTQTSIIKGARVLVDPINWQKYNRQVKLGQAVFIDLLIDLFPKHMKVSPFVKTLPHFLAPEDGMRLLEHNIYHSLRTADRYTWVYSETPDWWNNKVPPGIEAAIRHAKTKFQNRKPLGFDIEPAIKAAFKKCQVTSTMC